MIEKGRKSYLLLATLLFGLWRGKNIFLGTKIIFPRHVLIFSSGGFSYIASSSGHSLLAKFLTINAGRAGLLLGCPI